MGTEIIPVRHQKVVGPSTYVMLPDGSVRRPIDLQDWIYWAEASWNFGWRQVGKTFIGDMEISTVFLGLDHDRMTGHEIVANPSHLLGFERIAPVGYRPLVFETMIFGGVCDGAEWRYRTVDRARAGHARAVRRALSAWNDLGDDHEHDYAEGPTT